MHAQELSIGGHKYHRDGMEWQRANLIVCNSKTGVSYLLKKQNEIFFHDLVGLGN